jgi:hypothetical protein
VLGGVFRPSPGFWGDTKAATRHGVNHENNFPSDRDLLLSELEQVEATGERGVDPSVPRKLPEIMHWRKRVGLPEDPWSFSLRRKSAVATVLRRQGDIAGAEGLLNEASGAQHEGSYAGFRALARLSLACRWLEWQNQPAAVQQCGLAGEDASHVRDELLRQERSELVGKMCAWLNQWGMNPASLAEEDAFNQLQQKSGLERGLFVEFLSALWSADERRLKRLLPLALDDATTADAVLGRLLGLKASQPPVGQPFGALLAALDIQFGVEPL